ncbi:tetratricopeptide repeat protein [Melaminivora alkalimesophila]|nr:tetratricopeptide repeat protein [Melaminivora alkalimesophila]
MPGQPLRPALSGATAGLRPDAAREAAQTMVGNGGASGARTAAAQRTRGRRLVVGLLGGLTLAVLTWLGWQYWLTLQTPSLLAPGLADAASQAPAAVAQAPESTETPQVPQEAVEAGQAQAAEDAPHMEAVLPDAQAAAVAPPPDASGAATAHAPLPTPVQQAATPRTAAAQASAPVSAPMPAPVPAPAPASVPTPPAAATGPAAVVAQPSRQAHRANNAAGSDAADAVEVSRSHAPAQLEEAWSALQQGDLRRAQQRYREVLAERPDDADAALGMAVVLHRQGRSDEAWQAYQRSLQLWPGNETARLGSLALLAQSDPAQAESRLREWTERQPRDAAAHSALGQLLGRQGRWPEALGPLTQAQQLAPAGAAQAYNLAVALDQLQRPLEAMRLYHQALQLGASGSVARAAQQRMGELQELDQP